MADKRPDVYREDNLWVFRASSFFNCDRQLVKVAHGETPHAHPDVIQKAMDEGTEAEPQILAGATEHGFRMVTGDEFWREEWGPRDHTGQSVVELKIGSKAVIRCHPDGIAKRFKGPVGGNPLGDHWVVEAKKVKEFPRDLDALFAKMPNYPWQFSIEMLGTGLPGLYLLGLWEDGKITEVRAYPTHIPPIPRGTILKRGMALVKAIESGDEPACNRAMYPCGFWDDHDGQPVWAKKETRELTGDQALIVARTLEEAKARYDQAKVEYDETRREMLGLLDDEEHDGVLTVPGTKVKVTWKSGARRFDKRAAAADGVDIAKYEVTGDGHWEIGVEK